MEANPEDGATVLPLKETVLEAERTNWLALKGISRVCPIAKCPVVVTPPSKE